MMKVWGYEEDIVTCHTIHDSWAIARNVGLLQVLLFYSSAVHQKPAIHQYHGIISHEKNRLPRNGRRVKQEHLKSAQSMGVRLARHMKGMTCHNIFLISSAYHHWSELEDIFIIFTIEAIVRCWCNWLNFFFISSLILSLNNLLFYLWFIFNIFHE